MSGKYFPGDALHEKSLHRQIGVGTLVRSQERRAAVVLQMNQLSTGCQPQVDRGLCSPIGLHWVSFVRASGFRTVVYDAPEGKRDGCLLGEPSRRRPVLLRTAPLLRRAPTRPDPTVICPGFGFDK